LAHTHTHTLAQRKDNDNANGDADERANTKRLQSNIPNALKKKNVLTS